ncbi:unnamed protein product [Amaranthus hypochondriacus]
MKSNYEKEGYNIDVQKLCDAWKVKKMEEMRQELDKIKNDLIDFKLRKSYWENPKNVNSCEMIKDMEESLLLSLQCVLKRKKELEEHQMLASKNSAKSVERPFEDYIPKMLSGNDDGLLTVSNMVVLENQPPLSFNDNDN